MFKKIKFLFVGIISVCLFNTDAFCMTGGLKKDLLEKWFESVDKNLISGNNWNLCRDSIDGEDNPCIGESKNNCAKVLNKTYSDESGVLLMIATNVSEGGAYFCPVMALGRNENKHDLVWTEYFQAGEDCVWLCRDGYSGEQCLENNNTDITFCDNTRLIQSNYDSVKAVGSNGSTNIEWTIPNWSGRWHTKCGNGDVDREFDFVLIISNWTTSGYGAWVKPYVIGTARDGWESMSSWTTIAPALMWNGATLFKPTPKKLVCKSGFKRNATNTDCEPIDNNVCAVKLWCTGWDESIFDSNKFYEKKVGNCSQWRCRENGYGLERAGSNKCVLCGTSLLDGVNPENGTCVRCEEGYVFLASAKDTGYCATAKALDKTTLMYGTATNQSSSIDEQCWTKTKQDEYVNCVLNK